MMLRLIPFILSLCVISACSSTILSEAATPTDPIEAPGYPWQIFHDWSGRISNGAYTPEQREEIAAMGMGIWSITQALSDLGKEEFDRIRGINPDFSFTCVMPTMVAKAEEPAWPDTVIHGIWEIFHDNRAKHADGTPIKNWPPEGDATSYWHTVFPATGGYTYNRNLFNEVMDLLIERMEMYPEHCQGLWEDYLTTTGPYVFPDEEAIHGPADLDGDGIPFREDENEQIAWLDWEKDLLRELNRRMGEGFIHFPNGRAVYPGYRDADPELASLVQGAMFEGFPNMPWYNQAESFDQLYQFTTASWSPTRRGHLWRILFVRSTASEQQLQAARLASMIFLTPYSRVSSGPTIFYKDDHGIDAGNPTGDLERTVSGTQITYQREFENGLARVVTNLETGMATSTWTPN